MHMKCVPRFFADAQNDKEGLRMTGRESIIISGKLRMS